MITIRLNGGVGNKMFQVAATYSLALYNKDECAFNMQDHVVHQGNSAYTYKTSIFKKLNDLPSGWQADHYYEEPRPNYTPIPYYKNMMLKGYFASEKYFATFKNKVIDLFKEREMIANIKNKYNELWDNSVSVHIRRGDYVKSASVLLTMDYYNTAIERLEQTKKIDHIIVISDDIPWCKDNFKDARAVFIEGEPDYVDLYIQTLCNHNIISNSSFSWWGSYLNENVNKIVYAPSLWFDDDEYRDFKDFFCDNWVLIENHPTRRDSNYDGLKYTYGEVMSIMEGRENKYKRH